MSQLLLAIVLTGPPLPATPALPTDAFQQCAVKVLRGDYGEVPAWKLAAYRCGLDQGQQVRGHVWLTAYYPWEGRSGRVDSRGAPCTSRTAAANRLSRGAYLWVEEPCQMRQVLDRGARFNDRIADRHGCNLWADLWMTKPMDTHTTHYAVVSAD